MPPALVSHYLSPYWVSTSFIYMYCMARSFRGTKSLWIGHWQRFREKVFTVRRSHWVYANHTYITHESAVMASEFSVEAMVRGYHTYEDIWAMSKSVRYYKPSSTLGDSLTYSPFPFANRLFSMLFTPALAKTIEDNSTFVDREPVGSGTCSLVACPRY